MGERLVCDSSARWQFLFGVVRGSFGHCESLPRSTLRRRWLHSRAGSIDVLSVEITLRNSADYRVNITATPYNEGAVSSHF